MDVVGLSQDPETKKYLMIMQFADMGTLEMHPCDPDGDWYTVLTYSIKLASRLASLHEMGFIHEDLHPGNVVFHKFLITLLIDVGLSRAVEDAHLEEGVYGRMGYFPPEIFEKKQYTNKSDVYCLGTLLWQLIVGVPPGGIASVAVKSNPDGLRETLIPGAPQEFNDIIRSCWQLDPNLRPSACEIYNRLIDCAASLVGISTDSQPSTEDQILGMLAIAPVQFSSTMQAFIVARRVAHKHNLKDCESSNSCTSDSSASMDYTGSNFYTSEQLKQITIQNSRTALSTLSQKPNPGV